MMAGKLPRVFEQNDGFSLMELLAVLAVISTLAIFLAPIAYARYGESDSPVEETRPRDSVYSTDDLVVDVTRVNFSYLRPVVTQETFFEDYTASGLNTMISENLIADLKYRILGTLTPFDHTLCEGFTADGGSRYRDRSVRLIDITRHSETPIDVVMQRLC